MKGHIRKRGLKSWAIVLELDRDADGKRRQRWHSVKGSKRDAERELARLVHGFNSGDYVEPTNLSVRDYLETWLADCAKISVSPKSYERYAEIVRRHLIPHLGHIQLTKLKPLQIQALYSQFLREGRLNGLGGLSPQTVIHHHRILHAALKQAVRWQLLARNPVDAVEPPRAPARMINALDEEEAIRLFKAAARSTLYYPIYMAVMTGLRRGELLALKWRSVDLDQGTLKVLHTLEQTQEGLRFKEPKSAKSRRVVDLPSLMVEALRRHRSQQQQHRLKMGGAFEDHDLVFPAPDGSPWNPSRFTNAFAALARNHGFKGVRFHDLRHTHATLMLIQGVHPKIVSERLGHATIAITLDTYSHVLPGLQKEAVVQLDQSLRVAMAKNNFTN